MLFAVVKIRKIEYTYTVYNCPMSCWTLSHPERELISHIYCPFGSYDCAMCYT